ncbi:MAG: hypothetical protein JNJ54_17565 [Myxococcaceae bacterium]|nr:hypothetical protein [Myxococcaceae bacterium]
MDPALRKTVDALFDPARVTWSFVRPNPGDEPGAQEFFVGCGTREAGRDAHPRMLNWKLPQWRGANLRSSTEAVAASAGVLDGGGVPVTFRSHEATFDVTVGVLLAAHRLLHKAWPPGMAALVEYVSEWEQGRTEAAGPYDRALASVFYASMHVFRSTGSARPLIELIAEVLSLDPSPADLATLPAALVPARVTRRLKADADLYRTELSRAWKVQLDLPLDQSAEAAYRRIDALFLSSPQDVTVLKLLARPDAQASTYGRGFELMAVHAPNEPQAWGRHTISIPPESPGSLADLALVLDRREGPLKPDGAPRERQKPRFTHQPAELEGLSDPWYSDGYAWAKGRSTIVAPPFVGTRLSREEVWETIWDRFHVGRNVHVTSARTIFVKPVRTPPDFDAVWLDRLGFTRSSWDGARAGLSPSVVTSFLGDPAVGDVSHFERRDDERTVRVSLYPSQLALIWVEQTIGRATLYDVARQQAALTAGRALDELRAVRELTDVVRPVGGERWLVFGAYRVNRARSSMLDQSRSVQGLLHALAAGEAPTLANLPSESEARARVVQLQRDVEHWLTSTGGARVELELEDRAEPPALDGDFALFLLTTGQRYSAFEITRRMGELERRSRRSRWASLKPSTTLRADVMFFTNSLWYSRVSDEPDINARYDAWRTLHGMYETVESLRSQTAELDEYRKERFEKTTGVLLLLFLPITMATGFFSGAQFNEMELRVGLPWTTGGWKVFLIYTAVFTVLVFGALVLARLLSWRKR